MESDTSIVKCSQNNSKSILRLKLAYLCVSVSPSIRINTAALEFDRSRRRSRADRGGSDYRKRHHTTTPDEGDHREGMPDCVLPWTDRQTGTQRDYFHNHGTRTK